MLLRFCFVLCFAATLGAEVSAPTLTEVQQLKVQVALQRMEIAQQKVQLAQQELNEAQTNAQALLRTLIVDGYDLDLSTLTYVAKEKK